MIDRKQATRSMTLYTSCFILPSGRWSVDPESRWACWYIAFKARVSGRGLCLVGVFLSLKGGTRFSHALWLRLSSSYCADVWEPISRGLTRCKNASGDDIRRCEIRFGCWPRRRIVITAPRTLSVSLCYVVPTGAVGRGHVQGVAKTNVHMSKGHRDWL